MYAQAGAWEQVESFYTLSNTSNNADLSVG